MNYITTATNTRTKARKILARFSNEYVDGVRKELWVTSTEFNKLRDVSMISLSSFRKTREEGNKEIENMEANHHLAQYDNSALHMNCTNKSCISHRQYWIDLEAANKPFMRRVKNCQGDYILKIIN